MEQIISIDRLSDIVREHQLQVSREKFNTIVSTINDVIVKDAKNGFTSVDLRLDFLEEFKSDIMKLLKEKGYKLQITPGISGPTLLIQWEYELR